MATNYLARPLANGEAIPYHLLLLADPSKEMIDAYLDDNNVFVYEVGGEVVGVYVLWQDGAYIEIKNIAVHEAMQARGIGSLLINDAIARARDLGFPQIHIGTGNSSLRQLGLYQRLGFDMQLIKKHFFTTHYPGTIIEDGIQCKHLILLSKEL
ncbi:aminoglycoside 6'-N-acetyltransferase I [Chitinophaga skermanii]|uniref:Aminoglycoside 6'-N-acetyltransferase I n=1 Tax=Chitinophaga skermanii TaxID=331697 RepID=A0A327QZH0_9BACT|nr:GNAT family N-acetyltransferase [Chitinophaga skermanii]RAJ08833.1 aminoglycoside 6'-N-acetyltransferase I [Chitinophaga skermanii]